MRARDGHEEGLLEMQGEIVKQVEEFKYLGSTVQTDGGSGREITKWIQAGWGVWRKITGVMPEEKNFRYCERANVQDHSKTDNNVWDGDSRGYKGVGEKDATSKDENVKVVTWFYKERLDQE